MLPSARSDIGDEVDFDLQDDRHEDFAEEWQKEVITVGTGRMAGQ